MSIVITLLRVKPLDPWEWAILAFAAIGFPTAYFIRKQIAGRAAKGLVRQAQIRNGVCKGDALSFFNEGTEFSLTWTTIDRGSFVSISFQADRFAQSTLRIISTRARSFANMIFGGKYWDFLHGYTIQTNDEPFMTSLLTDEIQANLQSYEKPLEVVYGQVVLHDGSTVGRKDVGLNYRPGFFALSLYTSLPSDSDYDKIVETALMFCDRLITMADPTIVRETGG
jgi:hypothetical protein